MAPFPSRRCGRKAGILPDGRASGVWRLERHIVRRSRSWTNPGASSSRRRSAQARPFPVGRMRRRSPPRPCGSSQRVSQPLFSSRARQRERREWWRPGKTREWSAEKERTRRRARRMRTARSRGTRGPSAGARMLPGGGDAPSSRGGLGGTPFSTAPLAPPCAPPSSLSGVTACGRTAPPGEGALPGVRGPSSGMAFGRRAASPALGRNTCVSRGAWGPSTCSGFSMG